MSASYFTISRRQWRKMPPKTKKAIVEMVKAVQRAVDEGKIRLEFPRAKENPAKHDEPQK